MSVQKAGTSPVREQPGPAASESSESSASPGSPEIELDSLSSAPPRASNGRFVRVVSASDAPVDPDALPADRFLDRRI